MNVLTPQQRSTVVTLLQNNVSQHEISRKTGIDRKTIRKFAQARFAAASSASNSPMATGSPGLADQIPPPRPPAPAGTQPSALPAHARSACELHRAWIEAQYHRAGGHQDRPQAQHRGLDHRFMQRLALLAQPMWQGRGSGYAPAKKRGSRLDTAANLR